MQEKVSVSVGVWLYQEDTDNKIALLKQKEAKNQAEIQYDLPESQRSEIDSTIALPGSLVTFEHAVGLIANCVKGWTNVVKQGFKVGDL